MLKHPPTHLFPPSSHPPGSLRAWACSPLTPHYLSHTCLWRSPVLMVKKDGWPHNLELLGCFPEGLQLSACPQFLEINQNGIPFPGVWHMTQEQSLHLGGGKQAQELQEPWEMGTEHSVSGWGRSKKALVRKAWISARPPSTSPTPEAPSAQWPTHSFNDCIRNSRRWWLLSETASLNGHYQLQW